MEEEEYTGFNPLHCGAVVASFATFGFCVGAAFVSIPFIAGQWSLLLAGPHPLWERAMFQSPSLRGSGRFRLDPVPRGARHRARFNPLHCGAVVASSSSRPGRRPPATSFNPLHCGAVVASGTRHRVCRVLGRVSIPFIAGQWSLPASI